MRLASKVALVAGAGTLRNSFSSADQAGNGAACAIRFAREGAAVICTDRSLAAAQETARQIRSEGGVAEAIELDVTDSAQIARVAQDVASRFGGIDILHNNVGISIKGELLDLSEDDWDRVFNTNLKGAMLSNQAALRHMLERGIAGSITNVSSTASKRWTPMQFLSYNTSKAALNQMTRINARQYAKHSVRFNLILPGLIDTPHSDSLYDSAEEAQMYKDVRTRRSPMGRQGSVWEIAEAAVFINSDAAAYITGLEMVVDGGLTL